MTYQDLVGEHIADMCRYFCIGLINFMLKDESLLDYTNLLSSSEYRKEF